MAKPRIQIAKLDIAIPDPKNVRRRDDRAKSTLASSLKAFGAARSIVLDGSNVVRAGNGALEQAAAAGITKMAIVDVDRKTLVAVRRSDWSDSEAKAYAIADNRAADLSTFDYAAVQDQLREIAESGHDDLVAAAGFASGELSLLLDAAKPAEEEALDTSPQLSGMAFRIVIDCDNEEHQVRLLNKFNEEKLKCRALIS